MTTQIRHQIESLRSVQETHRSRFDYISTKVDCLETLNGFNDALSNLETMSSVDMAVSELDTNVTILLAECMSDKELQESLGRFGSYAQFLACADYVKALGSRLGIGEQSSFLDGLPTLNEWVQSQRQQAGHFSTDIGEMTEQCESQALSLEKRSRKVPGLSQYLHRRTKENIKLRQRLIELNADLLTVRKSVSDIASKKLVICGQVETVNQQVDLAEKSAKQGESMMEKYRQLEDSATRQNKFHELIKDDLATAQSLYQQFQDTKKQWELATEQWKANAADQRAKIRRFREELQATKQQISGKVKHFVSIVELNPKNQVPNVPGWDAMNETMSAIVSLNNQCEDDTISIISRFRQDVASLKTTNAKFIDYVQRIEATYRRLCGQLFEHNLDSI